MASRLGKARTATCAKVTSKQQMPRSVGRNWNVYLISSVICHSNWYYFLIFYQKNIFFLDLIQQTWFCSRNGGCKSQLDYDIHTYETIISKCTNKSTSINDNESDWSVDSTISRPCGCGSSMAKSTSSQVCGVWTAEPHTNQEDCLTTFVVWNKNIQLLWNCRCLSLPHWLIPSCLSNGILAPAWLQETAQTMKALHIRKNPGEVTAIREWLW